MGSLGVTTERLHVHFSLSRIGEGNGTPLPCSCLENPRDGGAWWAAVCGVSQSQTQLKQLSSSGSAGKESACNVGDLDLIPGWEDPLEKVKPAHSSILAWRVPWIVQSMGSQRVGHDRETFTFTFRDV